MRFDPLIEGMYADQYTNQTAKDLIVEDYQKRYPVPTETPWSHPWKFSPLHPPAGWRYDPYYELWIKETK